jgi:hypothetical protein
VVVEALGAVAGCYYTRWGECVIAFTTLCAASALTQYVPSAMLLLINYLQRAQNSVILHTSKPQESTTTPTVFAPSPIDTRHFSIHGGMKPINRLAHLKPSLFKLSYSPLHTSLLPNHIATNTSHPLNITQRRIRKARKEEGLWWHTTSGTDVSKSSCVRHWAQRRLRQAFVEELRDKGYDESGKMVNVERIQDSYVRRVVKSGRPMDMAGSLRMHGVPLLVPAKYEKVKEEVKAIVGALVQTAMDAALDMRGEKLRNAHGSRGPQAQRPQKQRTATVPAKWPTVKKMAAADRELSRVKPTASVDLPSRIRTAASAAPRIKPKAPTKVTYPTRKLSTMRLGEDHCVLGS